MGHHKNRYRRGYGDNQPRRDHPGRHDARDDPRYGASQRQDWQDAPPRRIPPIVTVSLLAAWSLLAWGAWAITPLVLGWLAGLVAPVLDAGAAVAGIVGAEKEVGAVIDAVNAEGIAGWMLGILGWLARPMILIGWAIGVVAIFVAPRLFRRSGGFRRLLH